MIGNPSRLTTYSVQFSPLLTSHGGTYTCQATIGSPYQTIQQSTARAENVSVQSKTLIVKKYPAILSFSTLYGYLVPPPVVSVLAPIAPVYAGSFLTLNCTIQMSNAVDSDVVVTSMWRKNDVLLGDSTQRQTSAAIRTNFTTEYSAQLAFSPLQLNNDDGLYKCEAAITSNDAFVLSGGSQSNNVSIRAVGMLVFMACLTMHQIGNYCPPPSLHAHMHIFKQFPLSQQKCNHQL